MSDRPVLEAVWRATRRFEELTAYRPKRVVMNAVTHRAFRQEPVGPGVVPLGLDLAVAVLGIPVEIDDRLPPDIVRVVWDEDEMQAGGLEQYHAFAVAEPVDVPPSPGIV